MEQTLVEAQSYDMYAMTLNNCFSFFVIEIFSYESWCGYFFTNCTS